MKSKMDIRNLQVNKKKIRQGIQNYCPTAVTLISVNPLKLLQNRFWKHAFVEVSG